jgi:glycosyltransferase involved in cell wall biosynthesis
MIFMKVTIVMPAYNEAKRIASVIGRVKGRMGKDYKLIVVDDGSKDDTASVARKTGVKVISYKVNRGVGYATSLGLKAAISEKPDIIVFLDSDGQHDPKYIPEFVEAIKNGADYAAGWRELRNYPMSRKIGNLALTFLTNVLCPTGIMDTECGFRSMSLGAARKMRLISGRYERDIEFAYEVWRNKLDIVNIKILVPTFHPKPAVKRGILNFSYLVKRRLKVIR